LDLAAQEGCRSVAFPSISTGIYGYPVDLAAGVALLAVDTWIAEHPDALDSVTFVLFSADSLEAFERASRS
jgi:O-acetyl-ADP-ribose deacetylase (regulator of RNase III)